MYFRIFALFLCFLIAFAAFPGCGGQKEGSTPAAKTTPPSWPPDTLKVSLVGAGHLRLTATWNATAPGMSSVVMSGIWSVAVGPDTTPSVVPPGPPPPATPTWAEQVKAIIDVVPHAKPHDALFLVKARPETGVVR